MASKYIPTPEVLEKLDSDHVVLNRVSKTVKGGRIARFAAVVIVGDHNGHIGYGTGKAAEVPEAIRKAKDDAIRNMITISTKGTSIPHEIVGQIAAQIREKRPPEPYHGKGVKSSGEYIRRKAGKTGK